MSTRKQHISFANLKLVEKLNFLFNNKTKSFRVQDSGRVYFYGDGRWVTPYDDIYGSNYYQNAESGGRGVDPILEWEHTGVYVEKGTVVESLDLIGRITDAVNISDVEIACYYRRPNPISRWDLTGMDNDAEDLATPLFRDFWINPTTAGYLPFTGAINDQYRRRLDFNNFVAPEDGWVAAYFKPTRATSNTANDYFYCVRSWKFNIK